MLSKQIFLEENEWKFDFFAGYYDLKPEQLICCNKLVLTPEESPAIYSAASCGKFTGKIKNDVFLLFNQIPKLSPTERIIENSLPSFRTSVPFFHEGKRREEIS